MGDAGTLLGDVLIKDLLHPVSVTSDGATGDYVDYNGYNQATFIFQAGLVATGDSDDTVAFQIYRIDDIAAASAASSDHVAITAGTQTLGPTADTDTKPDMEIVDIDFVEHSLDNGCFTVIATASEGGAIACSAAIILYKPSGEHTDTGMTWTDPASS